MRDLPERDDDPDLRQRGKRGFEIIAAVRDLRGHRPIARRQAFDRVEHDRPDERQSVVRLAAICALGEPELEQSRVEDFARIVAGERSPGAVRPSPSRGEPDDRQPCVGIAERRHGRVPPVRLLAAKLVAQGHEPRTQWAIARRFGLRDRGEVGGLGHVNTNYRLS